MFSRKKNRRAEEPGNLISGTLWNWPRDTLAGKSELKVIALKGCELTAFYYNFQALH